MSDAEALARSEFFDPILGEPIFTVQLPQRDRPETHIMAGYVDPNNGKLRLLIPGLDPTNFEAVVGPKVARGYRAEVCARRGWHNPESEITSPRSNVVGKVLNRLGVLYKGISNS